MTDFDFLKELDSLKAITKTNTVGERQWKDGYNYALKVVKELWAKHHFEKWLKVEKNCRNYTSEKDMKQYILRNWKSHWVGYDARQVELIWNHDRIQQELNRRIRSESESRRIELELKKKMEGD